MVTRDYVNSTLLMMKTRRHCLLTHPPSMAQRHITPYSSPSPMWLIIVSSAVVTRPVIAADHNQHRHHQHPPSPCLLLSPSIVVRSSSSFPHFPLRSLSPPTGFDPSWSSLCRLGFFSGTSLRTRRLVPIFYGNLRPAGVQTVWLLNFMLQLTILSYST